MNAEDLLAAIFPDQLACAENLSGEREIPDHPLVRETIRDCLEEAMDVQGFEGLLRYDHLRPNTLADRQLRTRTILGIAYWFPHQGAVSAALLLDYDSAKLENFTPAQPRQTKMAVHGLVSF